ncbi:MAG: fatty acid desaturase family protein [Bacteroidota bacterium]|jgi:linoleoyl-CoA desaturase
MAFQSIRFIDSDNSKALFFSTLKKRVDGYFKENKISRNYNVEMILKSIVFLSAYIIPFILILVFNPSIAISLLLWIIMGFSLSGIGMSIMHDANHGAYSSKQKINYWMGNTLNLVGGSVFNWKLQHNVMHHTYTNIIDYDDDIADKLILKFNPHTPLKWYHKIQFIYAFLFYGILTIYWTLLKDFIQFAKYTKQGVNTRSKKENKIILFKIVLLKIVYFGMFFALPVFVFHISFFKILLGFLLMQFIAGIILTIVFQLAHTVEGTSYPLPNENYTIENNWAIHQMNTTVNFSRDNKFISWYVGGLNFQVEHHLFPNICHVHYPQISEIVKSTAEEFGIPYLENKTFMAALKSHIKAVIFFGKIPNMNEAIV